LRSPGSSAAGALRATLARFITSASNLLRANTPSTRFQSFARLPRRPSAVVREHVGAIAADLALVDQAGEAAGAGEHAEQRDLGQADAELPSS
jgi:hypothetical protein